MVKSAKRTDEKQLGFPAALQVRGVVVHQQLGAEPEEPLGPPAAQRIRHRRDVQSSSRRHRPSQFSQSLQFKSSQVGPSSQSAMYEHTCVCVRVRFPVRQCVSQRLCEALKRGGRCCVWWFLRGQRQLYCNARGTVAPCRVGGDARARIQRRASYRRSEAVAQQMDVARLEYVARVVGGGDHVVHLARVARPAGLALLTY